MKKSVLKGMAAGVLVAVCATATGQGALADGFKKKERKYRVTVTNAMRGQPLAPAMVAIHDGRFRLFEIGDAPSVEIATMAETGNPGPLAGVVGGKPGVAAVEILTATGSIAPLTAPSESGNVEISASRRADFITVSAMLGATNDAFYAVQGVPLPEHGSITVFADAYDAGSEANNELDGDVPATPLGNANDIGIKAGDGEGFIHIHAGIHGVGDLDAATYDWRNPVAKITIERIR